MLDSTTRKRIDDARDILVGKVPDPKSQVEQITIALIYKFMGDMDAEAEELGGERSFFAGEYERYSWAKLMHSHLGGHEILELYAEAITKMTENPGIPALFRDIFKNAYLPYRDPETLRAFLKIIDEFTYDHSERLGDAFEYLLSVLGSQGDAGQFRTPRHIIDFMVEVIAPKKDETVLDPACGTAGFLISAWKYVVRANTRVDMGNGPTPSPPTPLPEGEGRFNVLKGGSRTAKEEGGMSRTFEGQKGGIGSRSGGEERRHYRGGYDFSGLKKRARELRQSETKAEALLWELLRNRQLANAKFRRQHQFGDYICDFFCHEAQLVIECDGSVHSTAQRQKSDVKRDAYLKSQGLHILRFDNSRILTEPDQVLEEIAVHLPPQMEQDTLPSSARREGGGEDIGIPTLLLTPDEKQGLARNFTGYDISPDMVRLSLVNLYLHGFANPHVFEYDTLTSDERWNEFADVILANPPFMSPKGGIKPHKRFSIKAKRSEVLFVDYIIEHLRPQGRAAIIVPEGIIFQSQTAHKSLRKNLVESALIAVISLPSGCFNPYSGVKTSILILDKTLAKQADSIAFFKVEHDGFDLGAQRRPIEQDDLPQVKKEIEAYLDALRARTSLEAVEVTSGLIVPKEKIAENGDYNLSGERYRENDRPTGSYPWHKLGELFDTVVPPIKIKKTEFGRTGRFPIIDQSQVSIAGWINDETTLVQPIKPLVIFGDHTCAVKLQEAPFAQGADGIKILQTKESLDPYYLFHSLRSGILKSVGYQRHFSLLKELEIPLPPLEVQKEIVAEIDSYQKVIDGARTVLDHYRPYISIDPDWPIVSVGEVCSFASGGTPSKANEEYWTGEIPWVSARDMKVDRIYDAFMHITEDAVAESATQIAPIGSLLVLVRGMGLANGVPICEVMNPCAFNQDLKALLPNKDIVTSQFLALALRQQEAQFRKVLGTAAHGTLKLNSEDLRRIQIPLPPLTTQCAIVDEIEAEQALVVANRELITRFEQKIQATLARVWGEEEPQHESAS